MLESLREAIAEAEELIAHPPFEVNEQELAEGYDYVAIDGLVRTNWPRTLAWTLRTILLGWQLWKMLHFAAETAA